MSEKLTAAIAVTYSQTWANVRTSDGDTESSQILAGVLQGDPLAPFLFIVALDNALRCTINDRESGNWDSLLRKKPVAEYLPKPWLTLILLMTYPSCPTQVSKQASYTLKMRDTATESGLMWKQIKSLQRMLMTHQSLHLKAHFSRWSWTSSILEAGSLCHSMTLRSGELEPGKAFIAWRRCESRYCTFSWNSACLVLQLRVCYCMGLRHGHLPARMRRHWTESEHGCSGWHSMYPGSTMSDISTCMTTSQVVRQDKSRYEWDLLGAVCGTQNLLRRNSSSGNLFDTLKRNTGLHNAPEIRTLMEDRDEWCAAIRDSWVGISWHPCFASIMECLGICFNFYLKLHRYRLGYL